MTLVEGEELQRLWTLVSELSSQLSANQQLCQSLQAQADELKGHALHSGTGYALRRFNTDLSKEKFEFELEKVNAQLVMENQTLNHENKQMGLLLREYESTLEQIMSKFRAFSHATQQHTLALTAHYETLLANNAYDVEQAELHVHTTFGEHLARLGGLVRMALRDVEGESVLEDEEDENESEAQNHQHQRHELIEVEGYRIGSPSGGVKSAAQSKQPKRKSALGVQDPRWYGTGGYTGSQSDPEAEASQRALETMIEEERLRKENEMLRELLRVSADVTPETAERLGISLPSAVTLNATAAGWASGASKLSLGQPRRGSRKSLGGTDGEGEPRDGGGSSSSSDGSNGHAGPSVETARSGLSLGDANDGGKHEQSAGDVANEDEEIEEDEDEDEEDVEADDVHQTSSHPDELTEQATGSHVQERISANAVGSNAEDQDEGIKEEEEEEEEEDFTAIDPIADDETQHETAHASSVGDDDVTSDITDALNAASVEDEIDATTEQQIEHNDKVMQDVQQVQESDVEQNAHQTSTIVSESQQTRTESLNAIQANVEQAADTLAKTEASIEQSPT